MIHCPDDPLADGGIAAYGQRLRSGATSVVATTKAYLDRIERLDPCLGAFQHVAHDQALQVAQAMDVLLASGVDLGPLMGVPFAIKDLFAVAGQPLCAGSRIDVGDMVGPEGSFVKSLKAAGCIPLGKCKTVEFARGASGISRATGTPWNPWDARTHRVPGGSSNGSAVAMAAGLCGFAIGTDTGGSVRGPAALCGVFGLKTTHGLWSLDGIFPNSPSFDTVGPLTRTAADASLIFSTLTGQAVPPAPSLRGLRLGKPSHHFFDLLEPAVAQFIASAIERLEQAGAQIIPVEVPEVDERTAFVNLLCSVELIAGLGRERFVSMRAQLDPLTVARAEGALSVPATEYVRMFRRHRALCKLYDERMQGVDAWITPTTQRVAAPVPGLGALEDTLAIEAELGVNTHLFSYFGLCAASTPIQGPGASLPVGLQTVCRGKDDARLLSLARAFESLFGPPPRPDLSAFLAPGRQGGPMTRLGSHKVNAGT
jgi:aspartyl-tRNA(Asn)/glutamyl-tRNA(Gln) amidotransferase subunit A